MTTTSFTRTASLTILAPAVTLLPLLLPPRAQSFTPEEAAALHSRFEPALGALRAGRVDGPAVLGAHERSVISAAQAQSPSLSAMRAGFSPTDHELTWLLVGAAIVLLIVLL